MFELLEEELSKWGESGREVEFWWRDDDVNKPSLALERLVSISNTHKAALSLAAIPKGIDSNLVDVFQNNRLVNILQHGYSHNNCAPPTSRKMELGLHRPISEITTQLASGFSILQDIFGAQFLPVMVPPWNRIDSQVVNELQNIGLNGISTLGPRNKSNFSDKLKEINVHIDILNWKIGPCFKGNTACIEQIVNHLSDKRMGRVDINEPTGIMTHHSVHDEGCWDFLDTLFKFLNAQKHVNILSSHSLFS